MHISTSVAFIIYIGVMLGAMVFSTIAENAPFMAFATHFTLGFIAYATKRLVQKKINGGT